MRTETLFDGGQVVIFENGVKHYRPIVDIEKLEAEEREKLSDFSSLEIVGEPAENGGT